MDASNQWIYLHSTTQYKTIWRIIIKICKKYTTVLIPTNSNTVVCLPLSTNKQQFSSYCFSFQSQISLLQTIALNHCYPPFPIKPLLLNFILLFSLSPFIPTVVPYALLKPTPTVRSLSLITSVHNFLPTVHLRYVILFSLKATITQWHTFPIPTHFPSIQIYLYSKFILTFLSSFHLLPLLSYTLSLPSLCSMSPWPACWNVWLGTTAWECVACGSANWDLRTVQERVQSSGRFPCPFPGCRVMLHWLHLLPTNRTAGGYEGSKLHTKINNFSLHIFKPFPPPSLSCLCSVRFGLATKSVVFVLQPISMN